MHMHRVCVCVYMMCVHALCVCLNEVDVTALQQEVSVLSCAG